MNENKLLGKSASREILKEVSLVVNSCFHNVSSRCCLLDFGLDILCTIYHKCLRFVLGCMDAQ